MCFSAEASFTGGVILSTIGIATLSKAGKPTQKLFAGIPLIFGLQQFSEGVLWTTLKSGGHDRLQNAAVYIFLFTALVIWPIMVPLSMWLMEEVKRKKKILTGLLVTGSILSIFYAFCLISYNVTPQIQSFHIQYIDEFPATPAGIVFIVYLATTVAPLFVSSVSRMWLFGVLITVSYLISAIFFSQYLTSVWCFFAALISLVIYYILRVPQSNTEEFPEEPHLQTN